MELYTQALAANALYRALHQDLKQRPEQLDAIPTLRNRPALLTFRGLTALVKRGSRQIGRGVQRITRGGDNRPAAHHPTPAMS